FAFAAKCGGLALPGAAFSAATPSRCNSHASAIPPRPVAVWPKRSRRVTPDLLLADVITPLRLPFRCSRSIVEVVARPTGSLLVTHLHSRFPKADEYQTPSYQHRKSVHLGEDYGPVTPMCP